MRSTSNPVRRLRREDFQGNRVERGKARSAAWLCAPGAADAQSRARSHVLKHATQASGDAAYVVAIPSRIEMHPFTAAPRHTDLRHRGAAQAKGDTHPHARF